MASYAQTSRRDAGSRAEDTLAPLALLVSPLAHVPWPSDDNPLVGIVVSAGLVTTFGLHEYVSIWRDRVRSEEVMLTGVPQGLVGCLLPFDLPRPPP